MRTSAPPHPIRYSRLKGILVITSHFLVLVLCLVLSLLLPLLLVWFAWGYLHGDLQQATLLLAGVAFVFGCLFVYIRAMMFSLSKKESGVEINKTSMPALFELIDRTYDDLVTYGYTPPRITNVYIIGTPGASTYTCRNGVVLRIGLSLLEDLSCREIQALLAHEYCHHADYAMSFYRAFRKSFESVTRFKTSLAQVLGELQELYEDSTSILSARKRRVYRRSLILMKVSFAIPCFLLKFYIRALSSIFRRQEYSYELYCDQCAAYLYGGEIMKHALYKANAVMFDWSSFVKNLEYVWRDIYEAFAKYRKENARNSLEEVKFRKELEKNGPRHPSCSKRITAIENIKACIPSDGCLDTHLIWDISEKQALTQNLHAQTAPMIYSLREREELYNQLKNYVADLGIFEDLYAEDWSVIGNGVALLMDHYEWQYTKKPWETAMERIAGIGKIGTLCRLAISIIHVAEEKLRSEVMQKHGLDRIDKNLEIAAWTARRAYWEEHRYSDFEECLGDVEELIIEVVNLLDFDIPDGFHIEMARRRSGGASNLWDSYSRT